MQVIFATSILDWSNIFKNIIEGFAILMGGGWALYRFGLFRERFPSMEINNGIKLVGENSNEFLLELYCIVENKGKTRKWIAPMDFELLYLEDKDKFESKPGLNEEISFNKFIRNETIQDNRKYWVPPDWYIPFVDGESKKRFHHLTAVPKTFKYLILSTRFIDFNSKRRAVKYIIELPKENTVQADSIWAKKTLKERVVEIGSKKTDFYYTQNTLSIEDLIHERKNEFS